MLTDVQVQEMQKRWEENLPTVETVADPFYTLMKFEGEQNTGELFAYPGLQMSFGRQAMVTTLFPTKEIGLECEQAIASSNPEWRLVGVQADFLALIVELVRYQEIYLTVSLSVDDSSVVDLDRVEEIANAIREQGFSADLLK